MVVISAVIAWLNVRDTVFLDAPLAQRTTMLCVWILVYPTLVPSSRWKILVSSFLAASIEPLAGTIIWLAKGNGFPAAFTWLQWSPYFICALLATIPAKVVEELNRKVREARQMGSYRLDSVLGRGGMGEVWRAHHNLLARPAAVKIIRADALGDSDPLSAEVTLQRFRTEAQATATLRSPHTIEVFDFGLSNDGTFYYVMELLEGFDLKTLVHDFGPVPAERTAHILVQACRSLAEAHARGLVHRDIKPANLYVCRLGLEDDFVKVLDFGLVKDQKGPEVQATMTGMVTGTPAYVSPEQARGKPVTPQSDLYSLGCVGYWLATGTMVFEADNAVEAVVKHATEPPPPLSTRSELDIPEELERVIMACLAKDPAARPGDARTMANALEGLAATWTANRAREWWETHAPGAGK
jgi:serine/threonine-protein kinase